MKSYTKDFPDIFQEADSPGGEPAWPGIHNLEQSEDTGARFNRDQRQGGKSMPQAMFSQEKLVNPVFMFPDKGLQMIGPEASSWSGTGLKKACLLFNDQSAKARQRRSPVGIRA
jgi:hypothetical protein